MSSSTLERGTRTAERGRSGTGSRTTGRTTSTTRGGSRATAARSRVRGEEVADTSGGTAPFVGTWLKRIGNDGLFPFYLSALCLISLLVYVFALREGAHKPLP